MKRLILSLCFVFSLIPVFAKGGEVIIYNITLSKVEKGGEYTGCIGVVYLLSNRYAGVNFDYIKGLGYNEKIICEKTGFGNNPQYVLYKEGKGMRTGSKYKIIVWEVDDNSDAIVEVKIATFDGWRSLKFKGHITREVHIERSTDEKQEPTEQELQILKEQSLNNKEAIVNQLTNYLGEYGMSTPSALEGVDYNYPNLYLKYTRETIGHYFPPKLEYVPSVANDQGLARLCEYWFKNGSRKSTQKIEVKRDKRISCSDGVIAGVLGRILTITPPKVVVNDVEYLCDYNERPISFDMYFSRESVSFPNMLLKVTEQKGEIQYQWKQRVGSFRDREIPSEVLKNIEQRYKQKGGYILDIAMEKLNWVGVYANNVTIVQIKVECTNPSDVKCDKQLLKYSFYSQIGAYDKQKVPFKKY